MSVSDSGPLKGGGRWICKKKFEIDTTWYWKIDAYSLNLINRAANPDLLGP